VTDTRTLTRGDGTPYTVKATGGTWDPDRRRIYFFATNPGEQLETATRITQSPHILVALNDLLADGPIHELDEHLDAGLQVLIDSGIFWMTNRHKRKAGITMDEALALAPEEIDGFDLLRDRYVEINRRFGPRSWGYIEMDQGGAANKRRIRASLEAEGLRPIPVWHPLVDGPDYFEELAEEYDRICMGNIVQADRATRTRLILDLWDRHRDYPDLFVHILGFTPNELLAGLPWDSCDSSSWLNGVRWGQVIPKGLGKPVGNLPNGFTYEQVEKNGKNPQYWKNVGLIAQELDVTVRNLRGWHGTTYADDLGLPMYPPRLEGEPRR
jgi:hypothetical protein